MIRRSLRTPSTSRALRNKANSGGRFHAARRLTHNGPVAIPGVRPCDQDLFKGSVADLDLLCRGDAPAVEQPPALGPDKAFPGTQFVWPRTPPVAGAAVKEWQQRMAALGFKIDPDGVYGPQSKAACAAFQRDHGLTPDGIVGPRTWAATFAA